jgi:hypothetical protein
VVERRRRARTVETCTKPSLRIPHTPWQEVETLRVTYCRI